MINITEHSEVVGTLDVYRCTMCRTLDVNERRISDLSEPSEIGFNTRETSQESILLVCRHPARVYWQVIKANPSVSNLGTQCPSCPFLDQCRDPLLKDKDRIRDMSVELYPIKSVLNQTLELIKNA